MGDAIPSGPLGLRQLEFDPKTRVVVVPEQETVLDRRSATVLMTLLEQFGQRIDKDELLRAAWPKQVVHENSLAKAISRLRRAIRGSGLEIAVSYGSGYTLRDVPVRSADPRILESALVPRSSVTTRGPLAFRSTLTVAMFGAAILFAVGTYAFVRSDPVSAIRNTPPITSDAPDALSTILWVDDHPSNNLSEVEFFRSQRIAVHLAESTEDALNLLAMNSYRLVISDLGRGEDRLAGLGLVRAMNERRIAVPVLIYTLRPRTRSGQAAQANLVATSGASDLAVTPQQVRARVLEKLGHNT